MKKAMALDQAGIPVPKTGRFCYTVALRSDRIGTGLEQQGCLNVAAKFGAVLVRRRVVLFVERRGVGLDPSLVGAAPG
jgi:hypothetical protein